MAKRDFRLQVTESAIDPSGSTGASTVRGAERVPPAVLEAVRSVANESRAALAAVRDRATHYRDSSGHLHVAGGRIVRMVVAEDQRSGDCDDDIPF